MTLIIFLVILSILILVHEFGHFIVAKLAKVRVEEFSIGFPPRIISVKYGETQYCVNALIFGGFVRLYGEEKRVEKDAERSFSGRSKKVRAAIIIAGVIMNFLLAIVSFSILYSIIGIPREAGQVKVVGITENSPAKGAGITTEEIVVSVDGEAVRSNERFIELIANKKGKEVELEMSRVDGQRRFVKLTPREQAPQGEGPLGVVVVDSEQYFPPLWQRPFLGAIFGFKEALFWGHQTVLGLGAIVSSVFLQRAIPEGIAGPVGIFQLTGAVSQQGTLAVLHFVGILSVNLAILNIVPFPALDGGRLLFVGIEALFRGRARAIIPKVERIANIVGFALLIALLLAITMQDLRRLFGQ